MVRKEDMKLNKYLIADGNSTLLVKSYKSCEKETIIRKYLGEVEQIGFISYPRGIPKLLMMGNELSINATLALAAMLSNKSGRLLSSGYKGFVQYENQKQYTKIRLSIAYEKFDNTALLNGIGYVFLKRNKQINKNYLSGLCSKYNLPAFGAIFYKKNRLIPYVYVKQTNSLFKETACGSASIVLNILTGKKFITQPTGEIITVEKNGNDFTISAEITKKITGGFLKL